ncbi:hypothetical protein [Paraburkholderia sartisoli]|uniref:Uncharacterized protein n=1 Tax=Paraburkholderia sartisoli TaxID=83784 RepID=A0A1H4HPN2_9BURK|nr:hypothetical protein [Paraburkholderia sartisoli]SEB23390.1 hypothetical protein SAMN05192564_111113 [Paraburkholderia sartisoli]
MLSPHEFATLLLVGDARDQTELNRADLDALFEHQFIAFEKVSSERQNPHLTRNGRAVLKAMAHIRRIADPQRGRDHDVRSRMLHAPEGDSVDPRSPEKALPV